jgi:hypothetical protein
MYRAGEPISWNEGKGTVGLEREWAEECTELVLMVVTLFCPLYVILSASVDGSPEASMPVVRRTLPSGCASPCRQCWLPGTHNGKFWWLRVFLMEQDFSSSQHGVVEIGKLFSSLLFSGRSNKCGFGNSNLFENGLERVSNFFYITYYIMYT